MLAQSYATGGWGPNERFLVPGSGALGDSISSTHASFETPCGAYGHFKIARYLMSVTGDSRYGDTMERVLYNTVLGSLPMKPDGTAFYYSDYNETGAKTYYDLNCSCCSGTLGQIVADYGISSYFLNQRGAVVNLYAPSRFRFRQPSGEVTLEQTTAYPLDSTTEILIKTATTQTFSISLRIPAWAGAGTTVAVNGRRVDAQKRPVSTAAASAVIHADQPGPKIDRHIYGQFSEHLGRGIYEGIWVGPQSPIPRRRVRPTG